MQNSIIMFYARLGQLKQQYPVLDNLPYEKPEHEWFVKNMVALQAMRTSMVELKDTMEEDDVAMDIVEKTIAAMDKIIEVHEESS